LMTFSIVSVVAPAEANVTPSATLAKVRSKYLGRTGRLLPLMMPYAQTSEAGDLGLQRRSKKFAKMLQIHRESRQD